MTISDLRQKFLDFFKEKGHAVIPSAPLIPENDPSALFNSAGMQPLVPYLKGEPHPMGMRLANVQKCLRTGDIDDVGDNRHLTFFEMLGNWSLGDYFKRESIAWSYEFLTDKKWLGVDPGRLYVSVFRGDGDAPRDEESIGIWQAQFEMHGITARVGEVGKDDPSIQADGPRIYLYGKEENWWPGASSKGLCGPDTEIFYDTGTEHDSAYGKVCHPNCQCGRFVEIWNNVFMQFNRAKEGGALETLPKKNVDTGMGLERTAAVLSGHSSVYDLHFFRAIIAELESVSEKTYGATAAADRSMRIIADHLRAAVFAIADGAIPSNLKQGYVVRRLIRRAIREAHRIGINEPFCGKIANIVIGEFDEYYRELETNREKIVFELGQEEETFEKTIGKGLKRMRELIRKKMKHGEAVRIVPNIKDSTIGLNIISGKDAFDLYQTYGFPPEMIEEELDNLGSEIAGYGHTYSKEEFDEEMKRHQELSRTASAGMFKGGLRDDSEQSRKLHTATHLLHAALRKVLGDHVEQKGSNITPERLRFDFSHHAKMTKEEIKEVEDLVNEIIKQDLPVTCEHMEVERARDSGALGFFEERYRDLGGGVSVYGIGDFSKEICGGPHVSHTGEIGSFKIIKEEASSAGVRRVKAVVG